MKKIPCLKCDGPLELIYKNRLKCSVCSREFRIAKVAITRRKISRKCVICGKKFKNPHSGVLTCSILCSTKHRKKYFKKYNKAYKRKRDYSKENTRRPDRQR